MSMKRWVQVPTNETTSGLTWEVEDFEPGEVPEFQFSMEEKLVLAHEDKDIAAPYLETRDIQEVVQQAMSALPFDFQEEELGLLYDVIYDAVISALEKVKTN